VIAVTIVVTILAMKYINMKVDAEKPGFVYARRKARCVLSFYNTGSGYSVGYRQIAMPESVTESSTPEPSVEEGMTRLMRADNSSIVAPEPTRPSLIGKGANMGLSQARHALKSKAVNTLTQALAPRQPYTPRR
jgi:hypothetical protein